MDSAEQIMQNIIMMANATDHSKPDPNIKLRHSAIL